MALFANDSAVFALEARLKQAGDAASPLLLTELAWQLRQRDTHRSLRLAEQMMSGFDGEDFESRHLAARIALTRAEAHWLFGQLEPAMDKTSQAVAALISEHLAWLGLA